MKKNKPENHWFAILSTLIISGLIILVDAMKTRKRKPEESLVMLRDSRYQRIAHGATVILAIAAIVAGYFAIINYNKIADSVDIAKENLVLTHKPIVSMKAPISPLSNSEDPFQHYFSVTNMGRLPANHTDIRCKVEFLFYMYDISDTKQMEYIGYSQLLLEDGTLYPENEIALRIPGYTNVTIEKAQATFYISYQGEVLQKEESLSMRFVFSEDTEYKWFHVIPTVDYLMEERGEVHEKDVQEAVDRLKQMAQVDSLDIDYFGIDTMEELQNVTAGGGEYHLVDYFDDNIATHDQVYDIAQDGTVRGLLRGKEYEYMRIAVSILMNEAGVISLDDDYYEIDTMEEVKNVTAGDGHYNLFDNLPPSMHMAGTAYNFTQPYDIKRDGTVTITQSP